MKKKVIDSQPKSINQQAIGHFLKDIREQKGLTQEQVAIKLRYSRDVISQIERGLTMPSYEKVIAFAKLYGISESEIYAAKKSSSKKNKDVETDIKKDNVKERQDYKPKKKTKKRHFLLKAIIITIVVLFLTLLIYLGYYFFSSYNSVRLYKVYGESEKFATNSGVLFLSKDEIFFSLSVLPKEKIDIEDISLRYINSNKEDELVCSQSGDNLEITFIDHYGYDTYLTYENMIREDGILYIEIKYNGIYELIDLKIDKIFTNDRLIFPKELKENNGIEFYTRTYLPSKIEETFKKDGDTYLYETKVGNRNVFMSYFTEVSRFFATETDSTYQYNWIYDLEHLYLTYIRSNPITKEKIELRKLNIEDMSDEDKEYYDYFKKNYIDIYID